MTPPHTSRTLFKALSVTAAVWGGLCAALGARALLAAAGSAGISGVVIILFGFFVLAGGLCIAVGYVAFQRPNRPPTRALSAVIAFMFFVLANLATRWLNSRGVGTSWEEGRAFVVSVLILIVSVVLYPVLNRWLREASRKAGDSPTGSSFRQGDT